MKPHLLKHGNQAFDLSTLPKCGARGRQSGKPCGLVGNLKNGRCKYHGGWSTGPKTAKGKEIIVAALHRTVAEFDREIAALGVELEKMAHPAHPRPLKTKPKIYTAHVS